ncbi:MAG: YitT family protein [Clostridia bacterium]|nr:YitT family protein [Clostridia bacterium]
MDNREKKARKPLNMQTVLREARAVVLMSLMITIEALAVTLLYTPAGVVTGGVTGIAMLITYATNGVIPNWIFVVIANVPLLILAFRYLHIRFTAYTLLMTVLFAAELALFGSLTFPALFDMSEPAWRVVSVIFGAVTMGVAGGMIVRLGGSTGGMDIVSLLLNRRYSISMGTISMSLNVVIALALGVVKAIGAHDYRIGVESAALSFIALFVTSIAFNNIILGINRTKTLFIISDKWDEIAPEVLNKMHRGVTYIPCRGAYTNQEKTLVYILTKTIELGHIRRIVLEKDPKAIISIIDTREVIGKGFSAVN